MSALDAVATFVKLIATALVDGEPTYNVTGIGGFALGSDGSATGEDDSDEAGEQSLPGQFGYSSLGIVGRALPPEGELHAEGVALRVDGGLVPIGWRDMRIHRALNPGGGNTTPAAGQLIFAGYGGTFLSYSVNAEGASIATLYVPHDFDADGVPQKAHALVIDPTEGNSSITLVHANGARITLTDDGIAWAIDDATFGSMRPGELAVNAERILLKGNVYLGAQAEAGVPLLAGAASPPSPSVFVSPV